MREAAGCRVAIVGAGYTAREHVRAFKDVPGVTLVGIHSRTRARAEALATEFGIATVCDSVEELHERTRADLVVVTVVELSMNAVCAEAFRFPWAIFVEKPPGYCLADSLEIQERARASRRQVYVALNRRALSATIAVREALQRADGPRFIKLQDQQNRAAALAGGQPALVVDNWMYANSIHLVDYLRVFARGTVTKVDRIAPYHPAAATVLVHLHYDSGDHALYEGIWHAPGPWAVSVTVPRARWELRPLEQLVTQRLGEKPQSIAAAPHDTNFKPGFRLQAEWMVAAATGSSIADSALATLDEAIETMRLVHAIFDR
jgi:predicted dehydrogenase